VPSVDRPTSSIQRTHGRQEPSLGVARASSLADAADPVSQTAREPSLGSVTHSPAGLLRGREPGFGGVTPGAQAAMRPETEPPVSVIGESRLRGDDPSAFGRRVPEFLEDQEPEPEGRSVLWIVGSILLALVLIVQSLVVFRNDIVATVPNLRGLLVQLCQPLACDVSYVRQIDRIFIVGSSLQQASDGPATGNQRAYVLRFTLQNRAAYEQPWPALMLTLTDASGTPVTKKALMPSEFLPPSLLEGPLAPRQEVALDIPVTVQGLNISGYELERFFP
jgi:hypothetical protein